MNKTPPTMQQHAEAILLLMKKKYAPGSWLGDKRDDERLSAFSRLDDLLAEIIGIPPDNFICVGPEAGEGYCREWWDHELDRFLSGEDGRTAAEFADAMIKIAAEDRESLNA